MLANYLIGLREGLEAALVVGILIAYLVKTERRDLVRVVWAGVAFAATVSIAFGALLTFGPSGLSFEAQEAIGGTLSILAVGLITWMIFWMARMARYMKAELHAKLDDAINGGAIAVFVVAILAVGREGLETALYLWVGAQAAQTSSAAPLLGAILGLATSFVIGWAIYRGALKLNLRVFFAWTGLFLIVVAAGVLAYGVHDLQEAGILPGLNNLAFDVSATIPPASILGTTAQGRLQLLAGDHLAAGRRVGRVHRPRLDPVRATRLVLGAAARARRSRRRPRPGLHAGRLTRPSRVTARPPSPAHRRSDVPLARHAPPARDRRSRAARRAVDGRLRRQLAGRRLRRDPRRRVDGEGVQGVREPGPVGDDHVQGAEHRRRDHRVLPARRRRPAGRRRGRERRPGPHPRPRRPGPARQLLHRVQAGHGRATGSGPRSRSPTPGATLAPAGDTATQLKAAEAAYVAYVKDQAGALITKTQAFADAYTTGDDDTARGLYAPTRVHWERIEPVAESFGDLDPLLDLREADLAEGDAWSGWHYIEKDLWPPAADANGGNAYVPLTQAQRDAAAKDLVTYTQQLVDKVNAADFSFEAFQISNGAKELLDEVATGKVTGEEEIWSHTDLWDFQANVDGARVAFEVLRDVAQAEDPALVTTLGQRFDALDALLAKQGSIENGFTFYDKLAPADVQALAAAVDALSEPLSRLTTTITGAG